MLESSNDPFAESAESRLASYLDEGETLLWAGRPLGGIRLQATDAFMIPFSLVWGGFACFWEASVIWAGAPFFFVLWGIPFVLIGCYFIFGRFIVDAKVRSRTYYGVTNERILILTGLFSQQIKSLQLATIQDITLRHRSNGRGTINFGPSLSDFSTSPRTRGNSSRSIAQSPGFATIENARQVYDVIRHAQRGTPIKYKPQSDIDFA